MMVTIYFGDDGAADGDDDDMIDHDPDCSGYD